MTKNKFKLSAEHIMYGIAIANALRLAWAYAEADAGGQIISFPGLFGLVLGIVISLGVAFIAGKLGARMTDKRRVLTWVAFILVLVLEPFILAPITMTHMSPSMKSLLAPFFRWSWAAALALVPSLVMAGIAIANGGLVEATAQPQSSSTSESVSESSASSSKGANRSKKGSGRSAKNSEPLIVFECPHAGAGCEVTKTTQQAINAHAGRCKFKPTISMPKEEEAKV